MKPRYLLIGLAALLITGCASFSTKLFRAEQTAVDLAHGTYVVYTNGLASGLIKVSVDESNAIKQARLKFAASVSVVDNYRGAYETNSAVKPLAQAALETLIAQGSNFVWLVNYVKNK